MSVLAFLLALVLALGGFTVLALGMSRHRRAILGHAPSRRAGWACRAGGAVLLAASLGFSLIWLGSPVGYVGWFGVLNAAALLTALGLGWIQRRDRSRQD